MQDVTRVFIAFPITATKSSLMKNFFKKSVDESSLTSTVGRLVGATINAPGVVRHTLMAEDSGRNYKIYFLTTNQAVLVERSVLARESLEKLEKYASHEDLQKRIKKFGLSLNKDSQVDGVVGLCINSRKDEGSLPEAWVVYVSSPRNEVLVAGVLGHLVARVAIERALLIWATEAKNWMQRLTWAAIAGYRIRRWPVQLLTDRKLHTATLLEARENFNLPKVREDVLDRARGWWSVFATILALMAFIFGIFQISNGR